MFDWKAGLSRGLLLVAAAGLALGGCAWLAGHDGLRDAAWIAATALVLVAVAADILRELRRGRVGVDLLALLAMAGALVLGQFLTGMVIALMVASGRALEDYAGRRARRTLSALLSRQPRTAHRYAGGALEEIGLDEVAVGDRLLIRSGELVPVDGRLCAPAAVLDESALTGEALPVTRSQGDTLRSGGVNAGDAFDLEARATASGSTYAGIIRLVEEAGKGKARVTRLADRYALWFIPLALLLAGGAWAWSGSPLRALAVLVVATPCPLILAAPVAIVAGISRAARRGLLIKNGGVLETLARARTVMFDKTGTLTTGTPRLAAIETVGGASPDESLRLAASLEQASVHVTARALVAEARQRGLGLGLPTQVEEAPGAGLGGRVEGHAVRVGRMEWLNDAGASEWARGVQRRMAIQGYSGSFVEVDGHVTAALLLADDIRLDTGRALRALRRAGIRRTVMVSGDGVDAAETVAVAVGVDEVLAECTPQRKVEAVEAEKAAATTVMVGDGINDAPALAAADVGVAMGVRGAPASSEAADAVLLVDRLDRLAEGLGIARRTRAIAMQSMFAGMGLSLAAMGFAAAGFIAPVFGALLQEAIDVVVIANALRALAQRRLIGRRARIPADAAEALRADHRRLLPLLDRIDAAARLLDTPAAGGLRSELEAVAERLRGELLPHEHADEDGLYPRLAGLLHSEDPLAAMSRTHREIFHLAHLYMRALEALPPGALPEFELGELRRLLYGLAAVLRLHFAQEEELFQSFAGD